MSDLIPSGNIQELFPILSIENNILVSKKGDITVCFEVELPQIFTLSAQQYELLHSNWCKAIKALPSFCIVHKQDWFVKENYKVDFENLPGSFLEHSSARHFNERAFLQHKSYLFLTRTTSASIKGTSAFSSLVKGSLVDKEMLCADMLSEFLTAVSQFESILNQSGLLTLTRLVEEDIIGSKEESGILEQYLTLSLNKQSTIKDIVIEPDELLIGEDKVCFFSLSDLNQLPSDLASCKKHEKLSEDNAQTLLSFAAPVGLLLKCNHIYNQYLFIEDSKQHLKALEKKAKNMQSLSRYSRENQINNQWIQEYLNLAHSSGSQSIKAHFNVMIWDSDTNEYNTAKNNCASQIAVMDCTAKQNTVDTPILYWAGIPGNSSDFPSEESFYTFIEQGVCLFGNETNYKDSISDFGIKLCDRLSGKPIHLDISDLPMKNGIITNRNKFILGPSGSGKSFFTNHMLRQYFEKGAHILLVDTGNSYQGLCELIKEQTSERDGIYFTYTQENPISFNPFFTEDGVFDIEKKESIKALILTLWKREEDSFSRSEEVALSNAINGYLQILNQQDVKPCFDTFYEYLQSDYSLELEHLKVREKDFDLKNFLNVLRPFYKGGEYDFLLNNTKDIDLLHKRFVVFEIDQIKDHKVLFPVVTIILMELYISKMRRLQGVRKVILIEEAWKAIATRGMAFYLKYLFKTVRKFFGEAIVVTQEVEDIISSDIVKESIINNADCKILLDQRKYRNKFSQIQELLGISEKEKAQILSMNLDNDSSRNYKEVWIGLGGTHSGVYATEVSYPEYLCYTTEEKEKLEVFKLMKNEKLSYRETLKRLSAKRETKKSNL